MLWDNYTYLYWCVIVLAMILWPSSMASLKKIMSLARKTSLPTNLIQMQTKSTAAKDRRYGKKKIKRRVLLLISSKTGVFGKFFKLSYESIIRESLIDWLTPFRVQTFSLNILAQAENYSSQTINIWSLEKFLFVQNGT